MAELKSKSAKKVADVESGTSSAKLRGAEGYGKVRAIVLEAQDTQATAQDDTLVSGIKLPIGTRFLSTINVSREAHGASVVLDIGLRNFKTKTVIDADGLVDGFSLAAAGTSAVGSTEIGVLIDNGAQYITTEEVEIYATYAGANPTDDAALRVEMFIVTDD